VVVGLFALYELADLFCAQARRRADALFRDLRSNDDATHYQLAQSVLQGRYEFFEHDVVDPAGDGPMIPAHEPTAAAKLKEEPAAQVAR
jgi:hypothetical protein